MSTRRCGCCILTMCTFGATNKYGGIIILSDLVNWIVLFIGIVLSIISIVVTIRATKANAQPSYQSVDIKLLGTDIPEIPDSVTILFKNTKIIRLIKTYIIFWNNGSRTMGGNDVVQDDGFKIRIRDGKILSLRICKRTRDVNKLSVQLDPGQPCEANITFDFLDPKDGVIIELLHTCSTLPVELSGTIKGIPNGIKNFGTINITDKRKIKKYKDKIYLYFLYSLVGLSLILFVIKDYLPKLMNNNMYYGIIAGVFSGLLIEFLTDMKFRNKFPKKLSMDDIL